MFSTPLPPNALSITVIIWLLVLTLLHVLNQRRFFKLTKGITKKDLRSILQKLQSDNKLTNKEISSALSQIKAIQSQAKLHFQKIGFMRYNPFSDTGGDQSFCLAILDDSSNGIVISSLHSRNLTRIYAKKIKNGKSPGYTLSKEERAVIKKAVNSKNN